MHLRPFLFFLLIVVSCTGNLQMIRDYFLYKNVTRVSAFSSGDCEDEYDVRRVFNEAGISTAIKRLGPNVDIPRFLRTEYWNLGVFLDLRCLTEDSHIARLFLETSAHYMFEHLHQWLILTNNISRIVQALNDSAFTITTDFVVSLPRNDHFVLYDLFNHCKRCGGLLNVTELATWNRDDGLNVTLLGNKFSRRCNYHGMKVKVAGMIVAKPKGEKVTEYLRERNSVLEDNWSKFGYSIMVHTAEMYNFTFDVIELNDWDENDDIGPLIDGFEKGTFDMGYFPLTLTKERLDYANVIMQVWPARTCFMFRTVPSGKVDMNIVIRPFGKNVWYMLCLFSTIIIVVLWMILRLEAIVNESDVGTAFIIIVASLCQQGLPYSGDKFASRIAMLQILIFGLLVFNYYSATIVSSRLNAPLEKMNDSLYSLVNSHMILAANKDLYFNSFLRSGAADVQYFRKYWETLPEERKFQTTGEGIKKIAQYGFAYHVDPIIAYPVVERTLSDQMICELTEVHLLQPSSLGLWSTHHSHFQEITKIGLLRIYAAGIRKRELERWNSRKPYCNEAMFTASSITFYETEPIIVIFVVGVTLSIVAYVIENVVFHVLQTRKKKIIEFERSQKKVFFRNQIPTIIMSDNK